MTPKETRELFRRHGTDKATSHAYHIPYARLLEPYRKLSPCRLLEIGIKRGSSLRAWKEIFPRLQLAAIDIDPATANNAPDGCGVHIGDQGDMTFLDAVIAAEAPWDIVIDDGSHRIDHQKDTFEKLWPHVRPGGLYVIEDLQSSRADLYSTRDIRRNNPRDEQTTLDWLFDIARYSMGRRRHRRNLTTMTLTFFTEACFITKNP